MSVTVASSRGTEPSTRVPWYQRHDDRNGWDSEESAPLAFAGEPPTKGGGAFPGGDAIANFV